MLFTAVFVGFVLFQSSADPIGVKHTCNNTTIDSNASNTRFYPSLDEVQGRYTAEVCTVNKPDHTHLSMDLTYNKNLERCDSKIRSRTSSLRGIRPGPQHSSNTVDVTGLTNCSHVCYAMDFDLIFSSCYLLKITWKGPHKSYSPQDFYYVVDNNVTKDFYDKISPYVVIYNNEDYITLQWILGIPAVDYNVMLHKIDNDTGVLLHQDIDVTQNCTSNSKLRQLHCKLAPPYGCYQASLEHGGLWTSGVFNNQKFVNYNHLCRLPVQAPQLAPRGAALWWACGAALLGAAALAAAVGLRRHLRLRDYHKRVLDFWFNNREVDPEATVTRDSRDVLLLYAREGEHGQQAIAALRDLIQHSTGGTVYDVFSPEVMALCGAAPHTWLRGLLARDDVRVLLLQTPAAAALYQDQLCEGEGGLTLREPLLGRRAIYRTPHYGDLLFKMALRQIAETADKHQDYHKYYFATYQGLDTELLPAVVAYRRYLLPGAARVLLAHLAGGAGPGEGPGPGQPGRLQLHERAARQLQAHVAAHPDYLLDEIFIN